MDQQLPLICTQHTDLILQFKDWKVQFYFWCVTYPTGKCSHLSLIKHTHTHTLNMEAWGVCIECSGHVIVHSQGRAPTSGSLSARERERERERDSLHISHSQ